MRRQRTIPGFVHLLVTLFMVAQFSGVVSSPRSNAEQLLPEFVVYQSGDGGELGVGSVDGLSGWVARGALVSIQASACHRAICDPRHADVPKTRSRWYTPIALFTIPSANTHNVTMTNLTPVLSLGHARGPLRARQSAPIPLVRWFLVQVGFQPVRTAFASAMVIGMCE
jgi:hypothetical protein